MVWGCFSWKGRGGLEFLGQLEMMNGTKYWQVLEDKLEFFMHHHQTTHFLQLIKWPGNSPDLNPIENVWAWMKQKLRDSSAKNLDEWKREIPAELWTLRMDNIQYLTSLVESMLRRLQEVIDREGWTTK
jgi:hypothetical protein